MSLAIGVKRERFLPFAHDRHGLSARLVRCTVDGEDVAGDAERRLVDLGARDWKKAVLAIELEVTSALLERVLGPDDREGALWVTVRCDETRLREGHRVATAPLDAGIYEASVEIAADSVYGTVEIAPQLVRASGRARGSDGRAWARASRLASGRPWELRSELLRPPSGKYLDVRYTSFADDRALARFAGCVYHLDADAEVPILWLDRDHEALAAVLDDKGTTGRRARMREVAFDLISIPVWTQLFWRAASHVDEEGASRHEWEEAVLRELLPGMVDARDHESRALELRRRLEAGEHVEILEGLDSVLQRRLELVRHLEALVREVLEQP